MSQPTQMLWILTVQHHRPTGPRTATRSAVLTPAPGTTRSGVYMQALTDVAAHLGAGTADLTTLYFSLDPEQL